MDRDGVAIELSKRVLFIHKSAISRAVVTRTEDKRYGLYLKADEHRDEASYLLVPMQQELFRDERIRFTNDLFQELSRIASTYLSGHGITDEEMKVLVLLWAAVPINLEKEEGQR